jgi:hypothetical protein
MYPAVVHRARGSYARRFAEAKVLTGQPVLHGVRAGRRGGPLAGPSPSADSSNFLSAQGKCLVERIEGGIPYRDTDVSKVRTTAPCSNRGIVSRSSFRSASRRRLSQRTMKA